LAEPGRRLVADIHHCLDVVLLHRLGVQELCELLLRKESHCVSGFEHKLEGARKEGGEPEEEGGEFTNELEEALHQQHVGEATDLGVHLLALDEDLSEDLLYELVLHTRLIVLEAWLDRDKGVQAGLEQSVVGAGELELLEEHFEVADDSLLRIGRREQKEGLEVQVLSLLAELLLGHSLRLLVVLLTQLHTDLTPSGQSLLLSFHSRLLHHCFTYGQELFADREVAVELLEDALILFGVRRVSLPLEVLHELLSELDEEVRDVGCEVEVLGLGSQLEEFVNLERHLFVVVSEQDNLVILGYSQQQGCELASEHGLVSIDLILVVMAEV